MGGFGRFLAYNNAVPIAVSLVLLGAGGVFAATNPEALYDTTETVVSIDNTYITSKDLTLYSPQLRIVGVTEDVDNYYVAYELSTIDVVDSVWKDITKSGTLTVPRSVLGDSNLGHYATRQFNEMIDHEVAYLREVQTIERKQVTQKTVATEYSGLIGALLNESTETIPGYEPPMHVETPSEPSVATPNQPGEVAGASTESTSSAAPGSDTTIPQVQILGANPAHIPVGSHYVDLGVYVTDSPTNDVSVKAHINDNSFSYAPGEMTIDTAEDNEWKITYVATDANGNSGRAVRTLIVGTGAPVPEPIEPEEATSTPSEPTETPEPAPETTVSEPVPSQPVEEVGETATTTE